MLAAMLTLLLALAAAAGVPQASPAPSPDPNAGAGRIEAPPSPPAVADLGVTPIELPGGSGGIGFDDLSFVPKLGRVLAPGGRTGSLFLIDPATRAVEAIEGFSAKAVSAGGHGEGITSADYGRGWILTTDRTALRLDVVDPFSKKVVSGAPLAGSPDYVRYVASTEEVWVTEPDDDRIEVFKLPPGNAPVPSHAAFLKVPEGPESLVIDEERGRAYTHLWEGATVVIDLKTRGFMDHWDNGCKGSRGAALDSKNGHLVVGCSEGKAVVLDVAHGGKIIDSLTEGSGVDIIAFDPVLSHVYFPGGKSGTMAILGLSAEGKLSLLGRATTAASSHCVAVDDRHQAWVCDPKNGRLLLVPDILPAAR